MKSFMELIKEKKKIVIGIAVAVVIIVAVIIVAVCTRNSDNVKKPIMSETIGATTTFNKDAKNDKKTKKEKAAEKASIKAAEKASKKAAKKEQVKKKQEDEAYENIELVEEGTKSKKDKQVLYKRNKKGEIVTNKKGEKVTRKPSYAGEDEGWSPIVSPEDLKKNK